MKMQFGTLNETKLILCNGIWYIKLEEICRMGYSVLHRITYCVLKQELSDLLQLRYFKQLIVVCDQIDPSVFRVRVFFSVRLLKIHLKVQDQ